MFRPSDFTAARSLVLTCLLWPALTLATEPASPPIPSKTWQADLTVPLRPATPLLTNSDKALHELLGHVVPPKKMSPTVLIKDGHYILYGDLFHTGDIYALAEITGDSAEAAHYDWSDNTMAAFALWRDGAWHLQGLWKIPVTWRPAEGKVDSDEHFPVTPSSEPFKLINLSDDRIPEVVIAGEIDKYFQENYLLRFSPKDKTLRLLASSRALPEKLGPYVRLYDNSGRRAIWGEWTYFKWKDPELSEIASWHDETPYNQPDEPFIDAEVVGKNGRTTTYHITDADSSADHENTRIITRNGRPYAKVTFVRTKSSDSDALSNFYEIETAWLYHRLTGLPLDTFPTEEKTPPLPFPNYGQLRLSGTREAIHKLSGRF